MILNNRPCCLCCNRCSNPNDYFYVEVKNECPHYINFFLYYNIGEKRVTKSSPVFGPGKMQRIVFPGDALYIRMKVSDCFFSPPTTICSRSILYLMISRFKVVQTAQGDFQCISI